MNPSPQKNTKNQITPTHNPPKKTTTTTNKTNKQTNNNSNTKTNKTKPKHPYILKQGW